MSELNLRLNKIRNAKLDKYQWSKYWLDFKKWSYPQGVWKLEVIYLENSKIRNYLNAPLVATFGNLKEEATKFIIS